MKFRTKEELLYRFGDVLVEVLGDPHLGKRFISGVPLHRRGEREEMVWHDFQNSLILTQADVHVCMGDLFDNFIVNPQTMLLAAGYYGAAATRNTDTQYIVLQGNHDMSRDKDKTSSFRIFQELVKPYKNIIVVTSASMINVRGKLFAFFAYDPFLNSEEMVTELTNSMDKALADGKQIAGIQKGSIKFDAVFGHWDLDSFGEMPHNMFPAATLAQYTDQAFTGHIHLPDIREYGNLELVITGSMQPYNHSEDPERKLYVSLTMDMLKAVDPSTLKDKCVRLVLKQDEEAPESLDCLQYTTKRMDAPEDDEDLTVELEDFDFLGIIRDELRLQGVTDPSVTSFIETEFQRLRSEEANA